MTLSLKLLFIILALVFFALATVGIPSPARFQWQPAGLFFLTLALLVNV